MHELCVIINCMAAYVGTHIHIKSLFDRDVIYELMCMYLFSLLVFIYDAMHLDINLLSQVVQSIGFIATTLCIMALWHCDTSELCSHMLPYDITLYFAVAYV